MHEIAIFTMQVAVSATLIVFSISMLVTGKGETSIYLPLLTGVTATWLPNPSPPKSLRDSVSSLVKTNQKSEPPTAPSTTDVELFSRRPPQPPPPHPHPSDDNV
jgi:hypothetical protein